MVLPPMAAVVQLATPIWARSLEAGSLPRLHTPSSEPHRERERGGGGVCVCVRGREERWCEAVCVCVCMCLCVCVCFRERIIHLLAVKPQRRSDIISRLKKGIYVHSSGDGLSNSPPITPETKRGETAMTKTDSLLQEVGPSVTTETLLS